jgi:hypothetical protein
MLKAYENIKSLNSLSSVDPVNNFLAEFEGDPTATSFADAERAFDGMMDALIAGLGPPPDNRLREAASLRKQRAQPIPPEAEVSEEDARRLIFSDSPLDGARLFICCWDSCDDNVRVRDWYNHMRDEHKLFSPKLVGVCRWLACSDGTLGIQTQISTHYFQEHVGVACPLCRVVFKGKTMVKDHLINGRCEFMQSLARGNVDGGGEQELI